MTTSGAVKLGVAALVLTLLASKGALAAEPPPQAKEQARKLLDLGDERMKAKDARGALDAYQAADTIMGVPTTALALAEAHLALGHLLEANDLLLRVARFPSAGAPTAFVEAQAAAAKLAATVGPRIPSLVFDLSATKPEGLEVTIDGAKLEPSTLGFPTPVNPGERVIVATAPGHERTELRVRVAERESKRVALSLTKSKAGATPASPAAAPVASTSATAPRENASKEPSAPPAIAPTPRETRISTWVWWSLGVGGLGLAGGAATGSLALAKSNTLSDSCRNDVCSPTQADDIDALKRLSVTSTALFAVGGAGVIAAVVGLAVGRTPVEPRASALRPLVGPGFIGLGGSF